MSENNKTPILVQQIKPVGMVKDTSPSSLNPPDSMFKSNPQFAFDIKNMRFIPLDNAELFDIVNERGNLKLDIIDKTTINYPDQKIPGTLFLDIIGVPIGINIMNNELILFTTETDGTQIIEENQNTVLYLSELSFEIIEAPQRLKINYELFPNTIVSDNFYLDLSLGMNISLIDIKNEAVTTLILNNNILNKKDNIFLSIDNYTFDYIIINNIDFFYKKTFPKEKKLFTSTLNTIVDTNIKKQNEQSIINVLFPNYTNINQDINQSSTIEYSSRVLPYPELKVINGTISHFPDMEYNNYRINPNPGFTTDLQCYFYNKDTNTWVYADKIFPEILPTVDAILVIYYNDIVEYDIPFYYTGLLTLVRNVVNGQYIYDYNINGDGSLIPENLSIVNIQQATHLTTLNISFDSEQTFSSIEISTDEDSEILTSSDKIHFENTNAITLFKIEGEYNITIKSL